jgi:hypothetical protein
MGTMLLPGWRIAGGLDERSEARNLKSFGGQKGLLLEAYDVGIREPLTESDRLKLGGDACAVPAFNLHFNWK